MTPPDRSQTRKSLAALHPVFALTGVVMAVGGPLMPSIARDFHLSDNESGRLFLVFYLGTALGALLCRSRFARTTALGFLMLAACCVAVSVTGRALLLPVFLLLGVAVGVPMSAISLLIGSTFAERCAPILTFLNFSWSAGALLAPLFAARILAAYSWQAAYLALAAFSALSAAACWFLVKDPAEIAPAAGGAQGSSGLRLLALFALVAFLQVGIEDTTSAWLATYVLRAAGSGVVLAAASSSVYWCGFIVSRAFSSIVLLRAQAMTVLRAAVLLALAAALLLIALPLANTRTPAMFLLGAALAPIYPLLLAMLFLRFRRTSDSRYVMACSGFGGSVLPWITGWISTRSGSLRLGLLTVPAALLVIAGVMHLLAPAPGAAPRQDDPIPDSP